MVESSRNYQNGKIYCIRNYVDDDVYVGSTIQALSKRMETHRSMCRIESKKSNFKLYKKMKEIGTEHFYIELIEKHPCECKEELFKKEGEWIRKIGTLNGYIAGRTRKESSDEYRKNNPEKCKQIVENWRANNEERFKKWQSNRWEQNKDKLKEIRNAKNNCECGGRYTTTHKSEHFKSKKHITYIQQQENKNVNNNIDNVFQQEEETNTDTSTSSHL